MSRTPRRSRPRRRRRGPPRARELTGRDVHLAGYSQGGMFAYQAAAYLASERGRVDHHLRQPGRHPQEPPQRRRRRVAGSARRELRDRSSSAARGASKGLPGVLTSHRVQAGQRAQGGSSQLVDFVRKLHDRQALVKREARRRFLGGEGFVAWPGPAFRSSSTTFIVHNRMHLGGFVIDGAHGHARRPALPDPLLRRQAATRSPGPAPSAPSPPRRRAPRPSRSASPRATSGSSSARRANRSTWPAVAAWVRWRDGLGPRPALLPAPQRHAGRHEEEEIENAAIAEALDIELFYDVVAEAHRIAWSRLGEAVATWATRPTPCATSSRA